MKRLCVLSLALWLLSAASFAFFFVRGVSSPGTDQRRAVRLSPGEKDLVLGEMRSLLKALHGLLAALATGDREAAARAAGSAGMGMAVDVNPLLMARLPLDFKTLGMGTHKAFDELEAAIRRGISEREILARMQEISARCIACHEANRLADAAAPGPSLATLADPWSSPLAVPGER